MEVSYPTVCFQHQTRRWKAECGGWRVHFRAVCSTITAPRHIRFKRWQYTTIIGQFHNSTAGHAAIKRLTVKRMHKAGISWPYLRELIRAYIRMCSVCQKMNYLKVPFIARRFTTTATGPIEVLNMDYQGSFPEDEFGNTYVLTIIDSFSRAVGLYICCTKS